MTEALGHRVATVEKIQGTAQPLSPRKLCPFFPAHCAVELQRQNSAQRDEAQRPGCAQTKGRLPAPIRGPAAARRVLVRRSIARRVWVSFQLLVCFLARCGQRVVKITRNLSYWGRGGC